MFFGKIALNQGLKPPIKYQSFISHKPNPHHLPHTLRLSQALPQSLEQNKVNKLFLSVETFEEFLL